MIATLISNQFLTKSGDLVEQIHTSSNEWACDIATAQTIFEDLIWKSSKSKFFNFDSIENIRVDAYENFETCPEDEFQNFTGYRARLTCNTLNSFNNIIFIETMYAPDGYKWVEITTNA